MRKQVHDTIRRNGRQPLLLFPKRKPTPAAKLKTYIVAIGTNGRRTEFKLAEQLFRLLPELRGI